MRWRRFFPSAPPPPVSSFFYSSSRNPFILLCFLSVRVLVPIGSIQRSAPLCLFLLICRSPLRQTRATGAGRRRRAPTPTALALCRLGAAAAAAVKNRPPLETPPSTQTTPARSLSSLSQQSTERNRLKSSSKTPWRCSFASRPSSPSVAPRPPARPSSCAPRPIARSGSRETPPRPTWTARESPRLSDAGGRARRDRQAPTPARLIDCLTRPLADCLSRAPHRHHPPSQPPQARRRRWLRPALPRPGEREREA